MTGRYKGIFPAMQCPFNPDLSIDEAEMRKFAGWLAGIKGIGGLVTNGHTGEVFALTAKQRAQATRLAAEVATDKVPVISGICCEGITEAVEHAQMAREAGASGLLVMPPHGWLRFGMQQPDNVIDFFKAVGEGSGLDIIVHVYPAWTHASYSFETLAALAKLPHVKCMKLGTRDEVPYPYVVQWEQYKLVHAALPHITASGIGELRFSTKLVGLTQTGKGVEATVINADGEMEKLYGKYLIGTDGGSSAVRRLAEIAFVGFTWPERFIKIGTSFDFGTTGKDYCTRNYFSDPNEWINLFKVRPWSAGHLARRVPGAGDGDRRGGADHGEPPTPPARYPREERRL
jgi:dihydrodipicolinate synthase/N-acetylneuraminate lyase